MLINIKRNKFKKKQENQVLNGRIFEPYKRQRAGHYYYDPDGIFSKRIFGNLYKCDCGNQTEEGICPNCGCRVVDPDNMPDFWIDLTVKIPVSFCNYESANVKDPKLLEDFLNYKKFIYCEEICDFSADIDITKYNKDQIIMGEDAAKYIGVKQNWLDDNTTDVLAISHTIYRPLIMLQSGPFVTDINKYYSELITQLNNLNSYEDFTKNHPFFTMVKGNIIIETYNDIMDQLYNEVAINKYSMLGNEVRAHPISGAVRGTLINRHDINEDVILIGDTLVETLWPYLYRIYNGDMVKINQELIDKDYKVLINRPPSICHLSIMAMKPRIASLYPIGHIQGTNGALLQNDQWIQESPYKTTLHEELEGDIEKYGEGYDKNGEWDGIDTRGLRCIGMNPIVADGLAGDYDGDVLLVISLYTQQSNNQAESMLPSNTYMNFANGSIRNHIIEDFLYPKE